MDLHERVLLTELHAVLLEARGVSRRAVAERMNMTEVSLRRLLGIQTEGGKYKRGGIPNEETELALDAAITAELDCGSTPTISEGGQRQVPLSSEHQRLPHEFCEWGQCSECDPVRERIQARIYASTGSTRAGVKALADEIGRVPLGTFAVYSPYAEQIA